MTAPVYKNGLNPLKYSVPLKEVLDTMASERPIKLIYNEDLLNRIHNRYPTLTKTEITLIVKAIFEEIRYAIFSNKIIRIYKIFSEFKSYMGNPSKVFPAYFIINMNTPEDIKYGSP